MNNYSNECATVTVVGQDGNKLVINASDYANEPDAWKLWTDDVTPASSGDGDNDGPVELDVVKSGKRFVVVNKATGDKADGFDASGYTSEVEAWTAITDATAG